MSQILPVLHGDVVSAARALLFVPAAARQRLCARLIHEARVALAFCRTHRRPHPIFGDGSLMAAARRRPMSPEPRLDDLGYLSCLEMIVQALISMQSDRSGAF